MNQQLTTIQLWFVDAVKRREFQILLLIIVMGFALRMVFLHEPFERDEGVYAAIGQQILRGEIPYRDAIEIKTPGILYLYALMISIVGPSMEGVRILTACYSLMTTCAVFWLVRNVAGSAAALWAAFFFAFFSGAPLLQGSSSNSEVFLLLPSVLTICMLFRWLDSEKRRFLLASGLFAGVTLMVKTVAAPLILVLGLFVLFRARVDKKISGHIIDSMIFTVPFIVLSALIAIYFYAHGALDDLIYWCFTFMKRYRSPVPLTQYPVQFLTMNLNVITELLLLWLAALPTVVWILCSRRTFKTIILVSYLVTAFIGVCMPGYFYAHYYIQLLPPLAILAGLGAGELWARRGAVRSFAVVTVLIAITGYFVYDYEQYFVYTHAQTLYSKYGTQWVWFAEARNIGDFLKKNTDPDDYIYQWGFEPEVYFYADRKIPNRFNTHVLVEYSKNPIQAGRELMWNLIKTKPKYIIVYEEFTDAFGYEFVEMVLNRYYVRVYKWRGSTLIYKRAD